MHLFPRQGRKQVLIRPVSKLVIKFLQVMQRQGYIGEFEVVDDHRSGKIVVELLGTLSHPPQAELTSAESSHLATMSPCRSSKSGPTTSSLLDSLAASSSQQTLASSPTKKLGTDTLEERCSDSFIDTIIRKYIYKNEWKFSSSLFGSSISTAVLPLAPNSAVAAGNLFLAFFPASSS